MHWQALATGLLITGAAYWPAEAQTFRATVISISDGDTLRLRTGDYSISVRLACIDAPETSQAPYGAKARAMLQTLAPVGSSVELRVKSSDRYGRLVAEVSRGGGNLNQALVASGAAFVYWPYIQACDRQTYSRLETMARIKGLGVWAVRGGVTRPWDVRAGRRTASRLSMGMGCPDQANPPDRQRRNGTLNPVVG